MSKHIDCPNCGHRTADSSAEFCTRCGSYLSLDASSLWSVSEVGEGEDDGERTDVVVRPASGSTEEERDMAPETVPVPDPATDPDEQSGTEAAAEGKTDQDQGEPTTSRYLILFRSPDPDLDAPELGPFAGIGMMGWKWDQGPVMGMVPGAAPAVGQMPEPQVSQQPIQQQVPQPVPRQSDSDWGGRFEPRPFPVQQALGLDPSEIADQLAVAGQPPTPGQPPTLSQYASPDQTVAPSHPASIDLPADPLIPSPAPQDPTAAGPDQLTAPTLQVAPTVRAGPTDSQNGIGRGISQRKLLILILAALLLLTVVGYIIYDLFFRQDRVGTGTSEIPEAVSDDVSVDSADETTEHISDIWVKKAEGDRSEDGEAETSNGIICYKKHRIDPIPVLRPLFFDEKTPVIDRSSKKYGYAGPDGDLSISAQYDEALSFGGGDLAIVRNTSDDESGRGYQSYLYINTKGKVQATSTQPNFVVDGRLVLTEGDPTAPDPVYVGATASGGIIIKDGQSDAPKTVRDKLGDSPAKAITKKLGLSPQYDQKSADPWNARDLTQGMYQISFQVGDKRYTGLYNNVSIELLAAIKQKKDARDRFIYDPINDHLILEREVEGKIDRTFFDREGKSLLSTKEAGLDLVSSYPDLSGHYWLIGTGQEQAGDKGKDDSSLKGTRLVSPEFLAQVVVDPIHGSYPMDRIDENVVVEVMGADMKTVQIGKGFLPLRSYGASFTPYEDIVCVTNAKETWYIHQDGKPLNDQSYKKAYPFSPIGLAYVETKDGRHGYIDRTGEMVLEIGDAIGSTFFDDGLAIIQMKNGREGVIDIHGKWVIEPQNAYIFSASRSLRTEEGLISKCDPSFNLISYLNSIKRQKKGGPSWGIK